MTPLLLAITLIVYGCGLHMEYALWPLDSDKFHIWQLTTYAFMHASLLHLLINVLALVSFGPALQRAWGRWRFLGCYMAAAWLGGLVQATIATRPTVGASAALFGLFAAYVVSKPKAQVVGLIPWPMPAWLALVLYAAVSGLALAFDWAINVAHAAHLTGMAVGVAFALNNKPRQ